MTYTMMGCDGFFAGKATIFVGERAGAEEAAAGAAARLTAAGLAFETVPCLQYEHLQLYYRASLYTTIGDIDRFLDHADWLRRQNPTAARARTPSPARRTAPTAARIELRDGRHATEALVPLIGRRMRLATRGGRLVFGNWWLGSLDAGTFEVASDFGLVPPACGYNWVHEHDHVILEVWPTGADGGRLDCVDGVPSYTTMVHVPFAHDIALHLVDGDGMFGVRDRTDDNLRGVFG